MGDSRFQKLCHLNFNRKCKSDARINFVFWFLLENKCCNVCEKRVRNHRTRCMPSCNLLGKLSIRFRVQPHNIRVSTLYETKQPELAKFYDSDWSSNSFELVCVWILPCPLRAIIIHFQRNCNWHCTAHTNNTVLYAHIWTHACIHKAKSRTLAYLQLHFTPKPTSLE